jgi:hypothetical protein
MKKFSANDFYLQVGIWIFACLTLAGMICAVRDISRSGDESNAFSKIAIVYRLQKQYAAKHHGKFASDFDELIKAEKLDEEFSGRNPVVNGYVFSMTVEEPAIHKPAFYSVNADPRVPQSYVRTARRHFYIDSTLGAIKGTEENRPARADDSSL